MMNRRQRYAMIGFLLGLAMIASMNIYYYPIVIMAGFILSLLCALAYSIFQYFPRLEKDIEKKI